MNRAFRKHRILISVLILGLFLRFWHLAEYSALPYFLNHRLDALLFHKLGQQIAGGDWLLGKDVLNMSPLFSYFVALSYFLFGVNPWSVRVFQIGLDALSIALIYFSIYRLWGKKWAIACALVFALYGPFVHYCAQYSTATLSVFCSSMIIYFGLLASDRPSRKSFFCIGLSVGLASLVRPNAVVLILPIFILIFCFKKVEEHKKRKALNSIFFLLFGVFLTIAPATLRNFLVSREFVPVTSSAGINFFIGNGPGANGSFRVPNFLPTATDAEKQLEAFSEAAEKKVGRHLSAREVSSFWWGETWKFIREQPSNWFVLISEKFALFWNGRELESSDNYQFFQMLSTPLRLPLVEFAWLASAALLGMIFLTIGSVGEKFVAASAFLYSFAIIFFFVLSHYRIAVVPFLIVLAVGFLRYVSRQVELREWKALLLATIVFIPASRLVALPNFKDNLEVEFTQLGEAYLREEKLSKAEEALARAISFDPNYLLANADLASLYDFSGHKEEALRFWKKTRELALAYRLEKERIIADEKVRALEAGLNKRSVENGK